MISYKYLKNCKKNAVIINTSRGEIWNENHVLKALEENKISGIASDVLTSESKFESNQLFKNKDKYNILLTPHIGGLVLMLLNYVNLRYNQTFLILKHEKFLRKYLDNFNQKCINSIFKWNNKKIHMEEFFDILIEKTKDLNLKKSKIFLW